eukprot:GEMP01038315.1.p1 GENE.GEMP01038315.1~~GEMP01038315.1.p1  ORF type:complete len:148 (+),score=12.60 GEMP01038315.1:184-627(+)
MVFASFRPHILLIISWLSCLMENQTEGLLRNSAGRRLRALMYRTMTGTLPSGSRVSKVDNIESARLPEFGSEYSTERKTTKWRRQLTIRTDFENLEAISPTIGCAYKERDVAPFSYEYKWMVRQKTFFHRPRPHRYSSEMHLGPLRD